MLVLTRKENEKICIGDDIVITIVRTSGDKVRLGIDAPVEMVVLRSELKERELNQNTNSVTNSVSESKSISAVTIPFDVPCTKCS